MFGKKKVEILRGNVRLSKLEKTTYRWSGPISEDNQLYFKSAYILEPLNAEKGIEDCVFRVRGRKFTDLSFLEGETLSEVSEDDQIRKHKDGTLFWFSYATIPTFDSCDRIWHSVSHTVVYSDRAGYHMIHCSHGYKVPRIEVYIGLIKSASAPLFTKLIEWLEHEKNKEMGIRKEG